jgi:hypothetical protein
MSTTEPDPTQPYEPEPVEPDEPDDDDQDDESALVFPPPTVGVSDEERAGFEAAHHPSRLVPLPEPDSFSRTRHLEVAR